MSLQLSPDPARTSKAPPSSQQNRRPTQTTRRHFQISRLRRGSLETLKTVAVSEIELRPLQTDEDVTAFRTLNEEWITRYFTLEPKDIATLGDPRNMIVARGGQIFFAYAGDKPVGCVALIPMEDGMYELSKMAVSPAIRGQGVGRRLLEYTIMQARKSGVKSLFLGSSSRLLNAVHLYESIGFRHVPPESLPNMHYSRADVFMAMAL